MGNVVIPPKDRFRKKAIWELKRAKKNFNPKKNMLILREIEGILRHYKAKTVLLYIPLEIEVNLKKLISKLRGKIAVFVPFMEGVSFKMVKYRLPLMAKKFNIYEPPNSNFKFIKLDVAIIPVLGVDRDFKRIGFGKGMYDRFFETLNYKPKIIFIQKTICMTDKVITNNYDIQADFYITPQKKFVRTLNDTRTWYRRNFRRHRRSCRISCCEKDGYCKI